MRAETWIPVFLHPAGADSSALSATTGSQQVGRADFAGFDHAGIWQGTAASFADVHPVGAEYSYLTSTTGAQQGGYVSSGGEANAGIWAGSAGSFVNLQPPLNATSEINATIGGQQAGFFANGGSNQAALWSGTAVSFVDLTPNGATNSEINGMATGQQAGSALLAGILSAGIWAGTPESFQDLNPVDATQSRIYATTGTQQAGYATLDGVIEGGIWAGTKASFQSVHPAGASQSRLYATVGTRQAGFATFAGQSHAGVWAGTAESFFDLHGVLPANYGTSRANGMWTDGTEVYVVGYAQNDTLGRTEAILWKLFIEPPAAVVAVKASFKGKGKKAVFTIQNRGEATDTFRLKRLGREKFSPSKERKNYRVKYRLGGKNVANALKKGRATVEIAAGAQARLIVKFNQRRKVSRKTKVKIRIQATSMTDASKSSVGTLRMKLKPRR